MELDMIGGAVDELFARANAADNRPESGGNDFPDLRWLKFTTGTAKGKYQFGMFLMTYYSEELQKTGLFRTRYQHFRIPSGGTDFINRTCMAKSEAGKGIRCPFCEAVSAELENTKSKEGRAGINQFQSKGYAYVNVLPTMILGKRPEYAQYEGDGKMPYLPHIAKMSEKLADKVAQFLRDNNALTDPNINPLNPRNAAQAIMDVDRKGSRPQDVRYDLNFAMARSAWAENQQGIDFLYQNTYDLAQIFRFAKEEEYTAQWEEVEKLKAEFARRRNAAAGAGGGSGRGYDAPSFSPPGAQGGQVAYQPPQGFTATPGPSLMPPQQPSALPAPPMFAVPQTANVSQPQTFSPVSLPDTSAEVAQSTHSRPPTAPSFGVPPGASPLNKPPPPKAPAPLGATMLGATAPGFPQG